MGVPKFFRYISERYPCLSESLKEYQIPEFDNLYLDMNGIIHNCSHPDDGDPHFRITEEKIFADIFHYIEILFRLIRPQKLFFMAIDGVAPRAKMNQQRGRRFRSAKEAEKLEARAKDRGEQLPSEERFDSNCITPGTVFMAKLHEQLKYFVVNKISADKLWHGCKVILSGHETPGEGEHKIMDYIRYMRAQPGYDPNTRHCLYGLDADLIMLGLCTHEPHFSLLREEVLFGRKAKKQSAPEQNKFFLLHLSLMREYLELEFQALKTTVPFLFDIEGIIDDWVLMSFLVGNDFIPNLPNFHIANGALPMLYDAYIKTLPTLDGYINEGGTLNLKRFEKFMEALCSIDKDNFTEHYADLKYFESKTGRRPNEKERTSYKPKDLIEWEPEKDDSSSSQDKGLAALIKATEDMFLEPSEENLDKLASLDDNKDEDENMDDPDYPDSLSETDDDILFNAEFKQHKRDYYMNKLDYVQVTPEVMRDQAEVYVRAIQWNLNYYYNGVCSWSWFYPHHYAPFISDIKKFQDIKFNFDLGKPFKPYEQLLAVLPAASKSLLPECYHTLMIDDDSTIKDYFPVEFNTDLNGKRQEWEAVVLIPFIDEKLLLDAMEPCNALLTEDEIKRNTQGPMLVYEYSIDDLGDYEAPEYFPVITHHHAKWTLMSIEDIRVPQDKLIKGAYPGALTDIFYPGFPTMKHLKYTGQLEKAKVKVFDQASRGENMIVSIVPPKEGVVELLAKELMGKCVFVRWPHLVEGMVCALSTKNFKYNSTSVEGQYNVEELYGNVSANWDVEKNGIIEQDHLGIEVGDVKILVHVKMMIGRKYEFTHQGRITLEKQWSEIAYVYPLQTIVVGIATHNPQFKSYKSIDEVFTNGSECFMLGHPHYGCMGLVVESKEVLQKGRVKINVSVMEEPNFERARIVERTVKVNYMNSHIAATRLGVSNYLFSRVTGAIFVILGPRKSGGLQDDQSKVNLGLNLKYNKKNEEIPGYTKKERSWLYSQKVVELMKEYMSNYPRFFEYLNTNGDGEDIFYEYEIFPDDKGSGETVKEIADWIRKQPYNLVERKSCGSIVLEGDVVKEIENIIDENLRTVKPKSLSMQVKPHLLYKPEIQIGMIAPDQAAIYKLYDRVINIRESYIVPLGCTGTVIAIHQPLTGKPEDCVYDIVFDKAFPGGMALNCSANRGYRLSKFALINKSHGQRILEQKTGKPGQLIQQLQQPSAPPNTMAQTYQQQNYRPCNPNNSAFASWNNPGLMRQINPSGPFPGNVNMPQHFSILPRPPQPARAPAPMKNQGPPKKDSNFFMPSFAKEEAKQSETVEVKDDNTMLLKKMLKIDDSPVKNTPPIKMSPSVEGVKVSVQDMFAHASANQKKETQQPTGVSYSLKLLSYFQEKGLGCPLYRYLDNPDGSVIAQLQVPATKELLCGPPAASKELACESVAKILLEKLLIQKPPPVQLPVNIPLPPKKWCERMPPKQNTSPRKNACENGNSKSMAANKSDSCPFVPLQAERHRSNVKSADTSTSGKHSRNNKLNPNEAKTNLLPNENKSNNSTNLASKPRRQRKMRIAANIPGITNMQN